ncbi:MAG: cytochrome c biogenesis protein ResB [Bacteroides sp.]|nr:cytochrome c biogenesis protein ResB [Bacteroides sp.]
MKRSVLIVLTIFITGLLIQAFAGYFPAEAFAFPINAAVLFAALAGLWVLWREKPGGAVCRWLASGNASIALIAAFLICCLILGMKMQDADAASFPGFGNVRRTWWFILISIALMANLFVVILSRRKKGIRFILNHIGVLVALIGCFFGAPDHTVSRAIVSGEAVHEAVGENGEIVPLPAAMKLEGFNVELDQRGNVRNYRALIDVDGKKVELRVNHPYRISISEDVYLTSYDRDNPEPQYCIVEVVRQPWKYLIWAGIVMMMAGGILMFARGKE